MDQEGQTVGALGEFKLIGRLVRRLGAGRDDTVVGAGLDDTAVLRLADGRLQLATLDALVEGTHFLRDEVEPRSLGRRLAAVNLSDLAAMGGHPTHALAGLVAPLSLTVGFLSEVMEGLGHELGRFGADLVGGNVAAGHCLMIDLALLGEVDEARLLLRSGARPGDAVLVTGALGGAAAARALAAARRAGETPAVADAHVDAVALRLEAPTPRLAVAPLLRPHGASAAIDLSDGLASDLGHVCLQSGVGAVVYAACLPVDPDAQAVAAALGADALPWALGGGEDYELLLTADPARAQSLAARVLGETGVALTRVGEITGGSERILVLPDGSRKPLEGGWNHFG